MSKIDLLSILLTILATLTITYILYPLATDDAYINHPSISDNYLDRLQELEARLDGLEQELDELDPWSQPFQSSSPPEPTPTPYPYPGWPTERGGSRD